MNTRWSGFYDYFVDKQCFFTLKNSDRQEQLWAIRWHSVNVSCVCCVVGTFFRQYRRCGCVDRFISCRAEYCHCTLSWPDTGWHQELCRSAKTVSSYVSPSVWFSFTLLLQSKLENLQSSLWQPHCMQKLQQKYDPQSVRESLQRHTLKFINF